MRRQTLAIVQTGEMNIQNLKMCHKETFVRMDPVADSTASRVFLLLFIGSLATQQHGHHLRACQRCRIWSPCPQIYISPVIAESAF